MKIINLSNTITKACIISDIHLGIHNDSDVWHDIVLDYGKWLYLELEKKNINTIFILGDIFNNRQEVGVNTLSVAEKFFSIFKDFNVLVLNGNHDSYLKDNSSINSIAVFKGWSNVHVIDDLTDLTIHGNSFIFCPWGTMPPPTELKYNVVLGHFEIISFNKTVYKVCEMGVNSDDLLKETDMVISGHFHIRQEREYKKGKILYVGCPFPQNFNDVGDAGVKGYYVLDLKDLKYEFFENTISPRYYQIKLADLAANKKNIPNNFIKLIIEGQVETDKLDKLISSISLLKPRELSVDFPNKTNFEVDKNYEMVHLDTLKLIEEFINNLEIKDIKDKVIIEMGELYTEALNKVKITNE